MLQRTALFDHSIIKRRRIVLLLGRGGNLVDTQAVLWACRTRSRNHASWPAHGTSALRIVCFCQPVAATMSSMVAPSGTREKLNNRLLACCPCGQAWRPRHPTPPSLVRTGFSAHSSLGAGLAVVLTLASFAVLAFLALGFGGHKRSPFLTP
jgi:hypothetical protein